MKKLLVILIGTTLLATMAFAGWNHSETVFDFANTADSALVGQNASLSGNWTQSSAPHGVVIDDNGNIWVAFYYATGDEFLWNDAADVDGDGVTENDTSFYRPLYCLSPEGEVVMKFGDEPFDLPGGGQDTIHRYSAHNGTGRGMSQANDGNILYSSYGTVYKINYQTGECMGRYIPEEGVGSGLTEAVQDEQTGLIYHAWVLPTENPCVILDENLEKIGNAIDTLGFISRGVAVRSNDEGVDLFFSTTWNGFGSPRYHSDAQPTDPISYTGFSPVDTLGRWEYYDAEEDTSYIAPIWPSSVDLNPAKTKLLVGCLQMNWGGPYGSRWYTIDIDSKEVDTIGYQVPVDMIDDPANYAGGGASAPRGGYFTDENTLYTVDFNIGKLDKWTYSTEAVKEAKNVATDFELKQNYPNPFNPTTTIPFVLDEKANVTLKIYNLLGQEVATVVDNKVKYAGYNAVQFDASNLTAGMYLYRLNVNGKSFTKKMMLMK